MKSYYVDSSILGIWFSAARSPDSRQALELRKKHLEREVTLVTGTPSVLKAFEKLKKGARFSDSDISALLGTIVDMDLLPAEEPAKLLPSAFEISVRTGLDLLSSWELSSSVQRKAKYLTADENLYDKARLVTDAELIRDMQI
jgi:predicted nucleic acid-binding protein